MMLTVKDEDDIGEDGLIGEVQLDIGHGGQLAGWTAIRWITLRRVELESVAVHEPESQQGAEEQVADGFAGKARQKAKRAKHKAQEMKAKADTALKAARAQRVGGPHGAGLLHFKVECLRQKCRGLRPQSKWWRLHMVMQKSHWLMNLSF